MFKIILVFNILLPIVQCQLQSCVQNTEYNKVSCSCGTSKCASGLICNLGDTSCNCPSPYDQPYDSTKPLCSKRGVGNVNIDGKVTVDLCQCTSDCQIGVIMAEKNTYCVDGQYSEEEFAAIDGKSFKDTIQDYAVGENCPTTCRPQRRRLRNLLSRNLASEITSSDLTKCEKDGLCRGCKVCKDLQEKRTEKEPFKVGTGPEVFNSVGELNRIIGGCDVDICTKGDLTKCTDSASKDKCEGCKMCHDKADDTTTLTVADRDREFKREIIGTYTTASVLDDLFSQRGPQEESTGDGSCMPACKPSFLDVNVGEDVCKWPKCKGCMGCKLYRENIPANTDNSAFNTATGTDNDAAAAFFRPRPRTIDSDNTKNANVPTKAYGGCHPWCQTAFNLGDNTLIKANNQGITKDEARAKVCAWKSCSGCLACVKEAERLGATVNELNYKFKSYDRTLEGACLGPFLCRSGGKFDGTNKCICD